MAEGGDDSAQDIHQPSNRNVHFWQNYYSIFENQDPPPHTHARNSDTHTHNDRERGFYDLYEINLFISTTARQHSTSKLFQRGLRQIGLHAPKTDRYLFIYFTEHSLHDGELDTSRKDNSFFFFYNLFVTSSRSFDQQRSRFFYLP